MSYLPSALFVLQLGIILFMARLGNLLFGKLKMPEMLGALCAGVLIGPFALGGIPLPDFPRGLFGVLPLGAEAAPPSFLASPALSAFWAVASIVFLFVFGLETDLKILRRSSLPGILAGACGGIAAFIGGDAIAMWLLPWVDSSKFFTFLTPECILLGTIGAAGSVTFISRILAGKGKMDSTEGKCLITGAITQDILIIFLLAIGMGVIGSLPPGLEQGDAPMPVNWLTVGIFAARTAGIWVASVVVGLLLAHKLDHMLKKFGTSTQIAVLAIGVTLFMAGLFERMHMNMLMGGYVMGLSFSRTDINRIVHEHLSAFYSFFVPAFFTVLGMMVDVSSFSNTNILIFSFVFILGKAIAKVAGCSLPALAFGLDASQAFCVGTGLAVEGYLALGIAGLGLFLGYLPTNIYSAAILTTVLTMLIVPHILRHALAAGSTDGAESTRTKMVPLRFSFPNEEVANFLSNSLISNLHKEGFFTSVLNNIYGVYQARKDDEVINISHSGKEIVFSTNPSAKPVVQLMMLESIVSFEQTLSELRKPLDENAAAAKNETEKNRHGVLRQILTVDTMVPVLRGSTKEAVVHELLMILAEQGWVRNVGEAFAQVMKRESAMSTGLRHGIACPHARTSEVSKLVCAVGIKPEGVNFNAVDERPATIIVLTLSPVDSPSPYMEFMSAIISILHAPESINALSACHTSGEMLRILVGE